MKSCWLCLNIGKTKSTIMILGTGIGKSLYDHNTSMVLPGKMLNTLECHDSWSYT